MRKRIVFLMIVSLSILLLLSSFAFCIIGAFDRSDHDYISPATAARLNMVCDFKADRIEKVYFWEAADIIHMDLEHLNESLALKQNHYAFICESNVNIMAVQGLKSVLWHSTISHKNEEQMARDIASVTALTVEGRGEFPVNNVYGFICRENPTYTLALYDTDMGFIWGIYQLPSSVVYLTHEEFLKYVPRDIALVEAEIEEARETGTALRGGYGYLKEELATYHPINVTLVREEGLFWTNSRLGTLYMIACAILHAAIVAVVWYVISLRKKKRLLHA